PLHDALPISAALGGATMKLWAIIVGRTPWSARDAPVPRQADEGVGRGPGAPSHHKRRLPLLLRPAMLALAIGAQQESDAAKAAKAAKAAAAKNLQAAKKAPAAPPLLEPVQPVLAW